MRNLTFSLIALLWVSNVNGQNQLKSLHQYIDSVFEEGISEAKIKDGMVSVVTTDSIMVSKYFTQPESDNQGDINPIPSFQIGSIGKVFTAMAVLQLVDAGKLDLDEDINNYVPEINIDDSFDDPITLRHLLTHTAGFEERLIGYAARTKEDIEPLKDHLTRRLPKRYIEPGKEISYSNYGYALAGYIVEKAASIPFTKYINDRILEPLKMTRSGYNVASDKSNNTLNAKGYEKKDSNFMELPNFYRHPIPAGGIYSTADDMAIFMQMLLNNGSLNGQKLLSNVMCDEMLKRQFTNSPLLTGYSLGLEEQLINGQIAFSKGGAVPGFRAIMIIYPELELGVFACINVNDDSFLEEFIEGFNINYIPNEKKTSTQPTIAPDIGKFTGSYRENRYSRHDIEDIVTLIYTNIWEDGNGGLACYQDGSIQTYVPIDSLTFRNTTDETRVMVFHQDKLGYVTGMSRSNKFAGTAIPAKYEKLVWYDTHTVVNEIIGFIFIGVLGYLLFPLFWIIVKAIRIKKPNAYKGKFLDIKANISAHLFALFSLLYLALYFFPVIKAMKTAELYFGMKESLIKYHYIPFILLALLGFIIYHNYKIWTSKSGIMLSRIYYSVFTLCCLGWLLYLNHWHFIGFNF